MILSLSFCFDEALLLMILNEKHRIRSNLQIRLRFKTRFGTQNCFSKTISFQKTLRNGTRLFIPGLYLVNRLFFLIILHSGNDRKANKFLLRIYNIDNRRKDIR